MKFFLDTADIEEIKTGIKWGVVDGVTTNPSLYAKVGGSYEEILKEILLGLDAESLKNARLVNSEWNNFIR